MLRKAPSHQHAGQGAGGKRQRDMPIDMPADGRGGHTEYPSILKQLRPQVAAETATVIGDRPSHDDARGHRDQQRRDLRDESIANREERKLADGLTEGQALLEDADGDPTDQVDHDDDDRCDGVADQ